MTDQKVTITILEELPTGYMVKFDNKSSTSIIPKKVFIRRVEAGFYEVSNLSFLTKAL